MSYFVATIFNFNQFPIEESTLDFDELLVTKYLVELNGTSLVNFLDPSVELYTGNKSEICYFMKEGNTFLKTKGVTA